MWNLSFFHSLISLLIAIFTLSFCAFLCGEERYENRNSNKTRSSRYKGPDHGIPIDILI